MKAYIIEKKGKEWAPLSGAVMSGMWGVNTHIEFVKTVFHSKERAETQLKQMKQDDKNAKLRVSEWERVCIKKTSKKK